MKPILTEKQLDDLMIELAEGKVPPLETVRNMYIDLNNYSSELLRIQTENRRRREQRHESYAV